MDNLHGSGLILASASPRRLDLLRGIGLDPLVRPAEVDESVIDGEYPVAALRRLAEAKAREVLRQLECESVSAEAILSADTGVIIDGRLLGKPRDRDDAMRMLTDLRGTIHHVVTAVCLIGVASGKVVVNRESTALRFRSYSDAFLHAYANGPEPMDKAGAYAIQGAGALLCESVIGSWSNVVGLPLEKLPDWFREIDLDLEAMVLGN